MTLIIKQNTIVVLSLFTLLVIISTIPMTYATTASNTTNTTTITPSELPEQGRIITSKGCGEGWGYYVDDPTPICEPVDKIGEGPPPGMAFCAAIGCPYNPPADNLPESPTERRGEGGVACAALYTYNPETGQCELPPNSIQSPVEPEPQPGCPPGYMPLDGDCVIDEMPRVVLPPEPEPTPEPEEPIEDENTGEEEGNDGSDESEESVEE